MYGLQSFPTHLPAQSCFAFWILSKRNPYLFFRGRWQFEAAKKKILGTKESFTAIADSLNFESIHYFTRFFKKMSGQTPSDFRQNGKL